MAVAMAMAMLLAGCVEGQFFYPDRIDYGSSLGVPLFVLHGTQDGVIPQHHGKPLFAAAREPKRWLEVEGGDHLDALAREPVRRQLLAAMERAVAAQ
jgi:pimeloyl-ACP methyl ester carboxylesterase